MAVAFKKNMEDWASIGGGWSRAAFYMVIGAYAHCTAPIHSPAHKYLPIAKNALYAHYGVISHKPPSYTCRALSRAPRFSSFLIWEMLPA